jgi:hypothetical protein
MRDLREDLEICNNASPGQPAGVGTGRGNHGGHGVRCGGDIVKCMRCGKECPVASWDKNGECPHCIGTAHYCSACRAKTCMREGD